MLTLKWRLEKSLLLFLHCKWGLSGAPLSKLILDYLQELNLSIDDCTRQAYDGAGSVAGHINGLSAQILKRSPKALYTHCYSHRLTYLFVILCLSQKSSKCLNM